MITESVNATRAIARFDAMPDKIRNAIRLRAVVLRNALFERIIAKLSGQVLNVRSGDLRRSIFQDEPENSSARIIERVASDNSVKYARIHEYGGKTKAHDILPVKAKALHFYTGGGDEVFAKIVHHPGSVIPERSYMRSSLNEMRAQIIAELTAAPASAGL